MLEHRIVNGREATAVSVELMRKSDAYTIAQGTPGRILMGRAAQGVFDAVAWKNPIAILCGGGNNGGDGYALSSLLFRAGYRAEVFKLSDKLSPDGEFYHAQALKLGVPILPWRSGTSLCSYAVVVDAILGTGFKGTMRGVAREAVMAVNASGTYVVSVDISSGLDGDTGESELAVFADMTVSIGYYKLGLFRGMGLKCSGQLTNANIGIILAD